MATKGTLHESSGQTRKAGTYAPVSENGSPAGTYPYGPERMLLQSELKTPKVKPSGYKTEVVKE